MLIDQNQFEIHEFPFHLLMGLSQNVAVNTDQIISARAVSLRHAIGGNTHGSWIPPKILRLYRLVHSALNSRCSNVIGYNYSNVAIDVITLPFTSRNVPHAGNYVHGEMNQISFLYVE